MHRVRLTGQRVVIGFSVIVAGLLISAPLWRKSSSPLSLRFLHFTNSPVGAKGCAFLVRNESSVTVQVWTPGIVRVITEDVSKSSRVGGPRNELLTPDKEQIFVVPIQPNVEWRLGLHWSYRSLDLISQHLTEHAFLPSIFKRPRISTVFSEVIKPPAISAAP